MNLETILPEDNIREEGNAYDLIVANFKNDAIEFKTLNDEFLLPQSLITGIGSLTLGGNADGQTVTSLKTSLYYVNLTGNSLEQAMKSVLGRLPVCGFSAKIDADQKEQPTGKYGFDPTHGRLWKVVQPQYNMRRGSTAEIHDVNSGHLDDDFPGYFQASAGYVAPWGECFVRALLIDGKWVKLYKESGLMSKNDIVPLIPAELEKVASVKTGCDSAVSNCEQHWKGEQQR